MTALDAAAAATAGPASSTTGTMAAGDEEAGFEEASASWTLPVERASEEDAGMTRLLEGGVLKREGELSSEA